MRRGGTRRARRCSAAILSGLLAVLPDARTAAAQGEAPARLAAAETPWTLSCGPTLQGFSVACQIDKQLRTVSPEALVAQVTLLVIDGKPSMRIIAPHELSIPDGLSLRIDGKDMGRKPFTTSVAAGIVALFTVEEAMLAELRKGQKLSALTKLRTGEDFSFAITLAGIEEGMGEVLR